MYARVSRSDPEAHLHAGRTIWAYLGVSHEGIIAVSPGTECPAYGLSNLMPFQDDVSVVDGKKAGSRQEILTRLWYDTRVVES